VTVPAPMLFSAAILSRGKPLNHCCITLLLINSSIAEGIYYIEYCYITLLSPSSDARQMSRRIGPHMELEWNGIVQASYMQYSTYNKISDIRDLLFDNGEYYKNHGWFIDSYSG
jgi:hypothetical protein